MKETNIQDIYRRLQEKIDTIGMGMPATESGCELTVLRDFFTEEEAAFAVKMPNGSHTAAELAAEMDLPLPQVERMLTDMMDHGSVFRYMADGEAQYYLLPPVHGYVEFNLKRFEREEARHFSKYFMTGFGGRIWGTPEPTFRILPVNREVVEEDGCLPCDDAEALVKAHSRFALIDCQCRKAASLSPKSGGCRHNPDNMQVCLAMDSFADFYVEQGMGEYTTMEKALEQVRSADAQGNTVEVLNTRNVEIMCACCGCCCSILNGLKYFGGESGRMASNYRLYHDPAACVGCGRCVERCNLKALRLEEGQIVLNEGLCLGCGVCVSTCPGGAMHIRRKPEEELYLPPAQDMAELYDHLSAIRQ